MVSGKNKATKSRKHREDKKKWKGEEKGRKIYEKANNYKRANIYREREKKIKEQPEENYN